MKKAESRNSLTYIISSSDYSSPSDAMETGLDLCECRFLYGIRFIASFAVTHGMVINERPKVRVLEYTYIMS